MKMRLHEEHTPALQTFREGHLEKRTEVLAQEELKTRAQLDSEMSILRGKLDAETRKGKYKAKERASHNGSTVVGLSIPPPSFKLVSLSLSCSPLF